MDVVVVVDSVVVVVDSVVVVVDYVVIAVVADIFLYFSNKWDNDSCPK